MTTDEALDFLRQHQPMPDVDAEDATQEVISHYEDVRQHLLHHPDARCIPLILNSFGNGDGWGIYQMMDEIIEQFSHDGVVPHLLHALASPLVSVRYWNAQIAMGVSSPRLIPALSALVDDVDGGVRAFALRALFFIPGSEVLAPLRHGLGTARDEAERTTIRELLQDKMRELQDSRAE